MTDTATESDRSATGAGTGPRQDVRGERPSGADAPRRDDALTEVSALERAVLGSAHLFWTVLLRLLGIRGLYLLGCGFGTLEWVFLLARRRRFRRAVDRLFETRPPMGRRVSWSLRHFRQSRCDRIFYLVFDSIPRDRARSLFTISNEELLLGGRSSFGGAYVALSHHGPHHVAGMLMSVSGYKVAGVRDGNESALRRYVQGRFDERYFDIQRIRMLHSDSYPRDIFRCFEEGYALGSAIDVRRVRHASQRAEMVRYFGEERPFLTGPLRVAKKCGAPAVQALIVPHPGFRYELRLVEDLLEVAPDAPEAERIRAAVVRYASNLESFVREHPHLMTRL